MKKQTRNTWKIAKSPEFLWINSLSTIIASEKLFWAFFHPRLSLLFVISRVVFYIWNTESLQQSSEKKRYKHYRIIFIFVSKYIFFCFLITKQNENKYQYT